MLMTELVIIKEEEILQEEILQNQVDEKTKMTELIKHRRKVLIEYLNKYDKDISKPKIAKEKETWSEETKNYIK